MNYTGRPSISGCRPVLSLYPTHCFCQYLLRIFITFTNSSLFTRAFSTNSRRALSQRLSLWERSSTSPSRLTPCHCPGCGSQRLLRCRSHPAGRGPNSSSLFPPLAAVVAVAPKGRGFGRPQGAKNPPWRSQLLGGFLIARDESAGFSHFCLYCMPFSPKVKHCTESLQSLFSLAFSVSFWRKEWYNGFAALPAHFMGREVKPNGVYFYLYPVRRSECSVLLHLQVA